MQVEERPDDQGFMSSLFHQRDKEQNQTQDVQYKLRTELVATVS